MSHEATPNRIAVAGVVVWLQCQSADALLHPGKRRSGRQRRTGPPADIGEFSPPVRVERVAVPPELDRLELVSRSGPYRVRISDSERWAAPLDDQIRRVLTEDLAERLAPRLLADPNEPATNEPRRLLSIAISEFYTDDACATTLRADWTLRSPADQSEHGSETIGPAMIASCKTGTAVAAAMSSALGALADRLADVILR